MRIAVGSGNPVKRDATARVFDAAAVEAVVVDSGVSEQPFGRAETRHGAVTRARRAFAEAAAADLAVGIEGGVAAVDSADCGPLAPVGDDLSLVMWAAVTDGDRLSCGGGPTLPLPDRIAARLRAGEELGPVMDDVLGTDDVAKKQGAAGAFTAGTLTRTDALESAVAAAAGPFLSDHY
ncbi:inosine/xanthosine triphosphatase [Salinigranum halophilum]|jgi:inosine/xanthosine triphosphatase|uniref:inosine/xanthosine triphosphatase n=1 Tax=Salinigranum halophilum TaxID=2565931 RepID=UPI00115F412F|nr:inosine/xanthosine triphosphatase [Salinigranum halophilum]